MIHKYLTNLLLLAVTILGATLFMNASYIHASTCLQLNSDLSYGMSDQSPSQSVYLLQGYLQGLSYLSATPNGHFGPSTRAAISQKTCSASSATPVNTSTVPQTISTPVPSPVTEVVNTNITSPTTGQVLSIGSSTVI